MKKLIAVTVMIAACATESTPEPTPAASRVEWTMYTHATCDGVQVDAVHTLCLDQSPQDYLEPGMAAANDAMALWRAGCLATQGHIGTDAEDHLCVSQFGGPAPYGCDASLQYEFRACD